MGKGGSRKHPIGCKCGNCPKIGRPKALRATDSGVADRVLAKANAERLWLSMIELEKRRLGILADGSLPAMTKTKSGTTTAGDDVIDGPDFPGRFSVIPLSNLIRYLEDRKYGRPAETVRHQHKEALSVNVNIRRVGS